MREAIGAFVGAFLFMLLTLPLWPFGIWAVVEWYRTPPAPGLDHPAAAT